MAAWFNRGARAVSLPMRAHPADRDLVSAMELNGAAAGIELAMRKSLSAQDFLAFESSADSGGYFGAEHDIRATTGRIKSLYSKEPWIFAGSTIVARTLSSIPLKVYDPKKEEWVDKHPLNLLLKSGGEVQSQKELNWVVDIDLDLAGNAFLILDETFKRIIGTVPVELCELKFDQQEKRVVGITVHPMNGQTNLGKFFKIEHVVHFKMPNPYTPFWGMSQWLAAARPILLDRYKSEFEMAFYLRGATSTGVIETTEDLSKSRLLRMIKTFEQAFTGKANWWRTLFLPKGAKWHDSSLTMTEMQHLEGMRENRKTILAVRGIPPTMVGLIEDSNRSISDNQERIFYNNTIVPMAWFVASAWNSSHLVKNVYGGKVEVRPDFSGITAVEGTAEDKGTRSKAMEPVFLIDEIREKVWGEKPLPDGRGQLFTAELRGSGGVAIGEDGQLQLAAVARLPLPPQTAKAEIPEGYDVQVLIFPRDSFTKDEAVKWASEHSFSTDVVDEQKNEWRIRQRDPDDYDPDTFKTMALQDNVTAIIAKRMQELASVATARKAAAMSSQNRIERRLGEDYEKVVDSYIDQLLSQVREAIRAKVDIGGALAAGLSDRRDRYVGRAMPVLERAMDRGFSVASSNVKDMRSVVWIKAGPFPGLNETDRQAVDVLRERSRDGQRRQLEARGITAFEGFDQTRTNAVMGLIEHGLSQGESYEDVARKIRDRYDEAYRNQARTIVRTEILSAVSQGLKWNHEVLGKIFSEVKKAWVHQGDAGINSDARDEHVGFEALGEVADDFKWVGQDGSQLGYPRDPRASAGQIINCRCTMISVIPDSAISQADAILESDT